MAILYLTEQQAWVGLEGDCLIIHIPENNDEGKSKSKRKMTVPLFKVEEVMVIGNITMSTPALARLLEAKVQITYLSTYGHYLGNLSSALTKNSLLRLAQHQAYNNGMKRHAVAQRFVVGKLRNMRTILMRYQRLYPDQSIDTQIDSLKRCISAAEQTTLNTSHAVIESHEIDGFPVIETHEVVTDRMHGLGSLIGCEGAGSAAYFSVFGRLIKCDWPHGFNKRVRRPPTDPVNAMLSYGYVILATQVASTLAGVGFDPYIGYLHASRYGKPALALDLMEEFRPIIVDSVVLTLLNNRQLEPKDFILELNSYRMTDATKRLFLQKFEDRMQEIITHPIFEYKVSYRRCIEVQARLLGKYLTGEVDEYTAFTVR
ncbi:MAG: type I-D CRISPR-associated endonuclease Cas1d [Ktedonobacteraceae bacterium]